jgi:hypothetical protein
MNWTELLDLTTGVACHYANTGATSAARRAAGVNSPLPAWAREAAEGCAASALASAFERQQQRGEPTDAPTDETVRDAVRGALSATGRAGRSPSRAALDGGGSSVRDESARPVSIDGAGVFQVPASAGEDGIQETRRIVASVFRMLPSAMDRRALRCALRGKRIPGFSRSESYKRIARARHEAAQLLHAVL